MAIIDFLFITAPENGLHFSFNRFVFLFRPFLRHSSMHTSNIPHQNRYDFLEGKNKNKFEMHSSLFENPTESEFFMRQIKNENL